MQILLQHMWTVDFPTTFSSLVILLQPTLTSWPLSCIFPQDFVESIQNDRFSAHMIVSKIIAIYLQILHLLCISRCNLVCASLSSREKIEQLLLLIAEIEDILCDEDSWTDCPLQLLINPNPSSMSSPEIRGWLFECYTHTNETEKYTQENQRTIESTNVIKHLCQNK